MATSFFLAQIVASDTTPPGSLSADLDLLLRLTRDNQVTTTAGTNTVAGPTAGVQAIANGLGVSWWSNPLDAVTISSTVTFNIWGAENNMSANVTAQVIIDRCDGAGAFISTITNSEKGTELPVTTRAAQNWTAAPTSTTLSAGDRIRVRLYGNDFGTMGSGFTFNYSCGVASAGVDGDSFVTFTETITEQGGAPAANPPYRNPIFNLLPQ